MADQLAPSKRHAHEHEGRVVYEWDQTLDELNLYVPVPKGIGAKMLDVDVGADALKFGIRGNPPYLAHDLSHSVKTSDCFWTLEDGELHVTLQKMKRGKPWDALFKGHEGGLDAFAEREERERLMKERFQEENPGFDFSGAAFNGEAPSADAFMGGIKHAS